MEGYAGNFQTLVIFLASVTVDRRLPKGGDLCVWFTCVLSVAFGGCSEIKFEGTVYVRVCAHARQAFSPSERFQVIFRHREVF